MIPYFAKNKHVLEIIQSSSVYFCESSDLDLICLVVEFKKKTNYFNDHNKINMRDNKQVNAFVVYHPLKYCIL